jgi:O-antigen/teichoic acid export membrane protein
MPPLVTPSPTMTESDASPSLAIRTATGAGWVIMWRMATRILGVCSTVVLVRVLAPADFGLIALATSATQAVDWLSSFGIYEALIREKELDKALYDTGFTLNVFRCVLTASVILLGAWPVAVFFNDDRLGTVLMVLAGVSALAAFENIGVLDFRRTLAFEKEFQLAVVPRVLSILVSIAVAVTFVNYWALVAGIVTNRVLRLLMGYWMHPYRPGLSLAAWRRIIGFSFWTWLNAVTIMVRDRVDAVVIGRLFGPTQVGVYAVGWEIGSLTSTELVEPVTAALFAGFSAAQRAGSNVAEGYFKAISATLLLTLPMGFGLSMLAAPVIEVAFGTRWLQAVPLVQIFALVCMAKVVAYISGVLLNANGMLRVQFKILLASLIVRIALLLVLVAPFGLLGAAFAATGCIAAEEILYMVVTFRRFSLRTVDLVRGSWRCVLATGVMAVMLMAQGIGWASAPTGTGEAALVIAQGVLTGAATYGIALLALWWAAGRPRGAETAFLDIIGNTLKHLGRRWLRA